MNLQDLLITRLIESKGAAHFLDKYVSGMCRRTKLQQVVDEVVADIKVDVKDDVQKAKTSGAQFCVQGDTWKPKMKRRKHYLAVLLTWVSKEWEVEERCIHVKDMPKPRTHKEYHAAFVEALANVGLTSGDLICTVSDHEGAIRKGLRLLDVPSVGCGCHAFQLPVKHIVPPLKKKGDADVITASDSESEGSSSAADSASEAANQEPLDHCEERQALIAFYTPLNNKVRALVKWYVHHEDNTNELEGNSKKQGLLF